MNSIFAEKLQNNPISWIESSVGVEQPEREAPQQAWYGREWGGADRADNGRVDEAGGGVQQTVGGSSAAQRISAGRTAAGGREHCDQPGDQDAGDCRGLQNQSGKLSLEGGGERSSQCFTSLTHQDDEVILNVHTRVFTSARFFTG